MINRILKRFFILVCVTVVGVLAVSYASVNLFDSTLRIERVLLASEDADSAPYLHAYEVSQYPVEQLNEFSASQLPISLLQRLRIGYGKTDDDEAQVVLSFTEASMWQLWQNLFYRSAVIEAAKALSVHHEASREEALVARSIADQISQAVMLGDADLLQLRLESLPNVSATPDISQLMAQFKRFDMAEAGKAVIYLKNQNLARFRYDYVSPSLERAWLVVDVLLGDSLALAAVDVQVVQDGQ